MFWEVSHTGGRIYNPDTHEVSPKKEFIELEIERLQKQIESLTEAEIAYTKRVGEIRVSLKDEIKTLKEKLKSY